MSFGVPAGAYDRFMGRYSVMLSPQLCDLAGVRSGLRVLDVGCGPGALTAELVARVGPESVAAVDPSETFVAAAHERQPDVDVRRASAEELPFEDVSFDAALAQLVVQFMGDPVAGVAEMRRVTRPDGVVAACVWDHGTGHGPLSPFWRAVHELVPDAADESKAVGTSPGELSEVFRDAGLRDVEETMLTVSVEHPSFEEWWDPFTLGVGPAGAYVAKLSVDGRTRVRDRLREQLSDGPFVLTARAWAARGVV